MLEYTKEKIGTFWFTLLLLIDSINRSPNLLAFVMVVYGGHLGNSMGEKIIIGGLGVFSGGAMARNGTPASSLPS